MTPPDWSRISRWAPQTIDQFHEIGWQRHLELEFLSGHRMNETQFRGVQGDPGRATMVGDTWSWESASVHLVTAEWMAGLGEMDADLMRPTGFQLALDHCVTGEIFQRPDMCDCDLAQLGVRSAAPAPISAIVNEPCLDGSGFDMPKGNRDVDPMK